MDKLCDTPKEIQPGGRNQQFSEWRTSKHAANNIGCLTCHDPHNTSGQPHILKQGVKETCAQCHPEQGADMVKHAPTAKPGDTCATCHMPGGSHMFKKPQKK
jgi:predicted CXXCH cytochrome family protein